MPLIALSTLMGGTVVVTGANSPVGLRSMPVKYLFLDEVDAYPGDSGGEGDPVLLSIARTNTFNGVNLRKNISDCV